MWAPIALWSIAMSYNVQRLPTWRAQVRHSAMYRSTGTLEPTRLRS